MAKIDSYEFGKMVIDGKLYDFDLLILPDGTVKARDPLKGKHKITGREVSSLYDLHADVAIVGIGAYGRAELTPKASEFLAEAAFKPLVLRTPLAAEEFNRAAGKGKRVAALIHVTC